MSMLLQEIVASDNLPSLPQVALRVIELARDPDPDFDEVIRTVRTDPALSSKLLKTANSALFGLRQPLPSIEAAIPMLGMTLVRTIVLGFTLAKQSEGAQRVREAMQQLWRSSLTQAAFAELLAGEIPDADPPTYFLTALLQDVGILAMLQVDSEYYTEHVWEPSDFPNVIANERQYYGFTHLDVGKAMCSRWGFADEICDAIATHHRRMRLDSPASPSLSTALQAASLCSQYVENPSVPGNRYFEELVSFLMLNYEWPLEKTEEALQDTIFRVNNTAAQFSFDVGEGHSTERLMSDAKRILEEIAVSCQMNSLGAAPANGTAKNRKRLEDEVMRDPMTGTYNRRFMDQVLNDRLLRDIRRKKPMGFLFLDIDRFKSINDEHGHKFGDEAICQVAKILNQNVRKSDFVIRYGGDEFLVALLRIDGAELERVAERIRSEIHRSAIGTECDIHMTTSVGAVHYRPTADDPLDANWLIDHVDKAMYEAKKNGGDQVRLYHALGESIETITTSSPV